MRVVDFSGRRSGFDVVVDVLASPITDLLLSTVVALGDLDDDSEAVWEYDLDPASLTAMREASGEELFDELRAIAGDGPKLMLTLLPTILDCPDPSNLDVYLDHLDKLDPCELWAIVLSNHTQGWVDVTEDTVRRAARGDEVAIRTLRRASDDDTTSPAFVDMVLATEPADLHQRLVEVLRGWHKRVWPLLETQSMTTMQRDAEAKRARIGDIDLSALVLEATNGLEWTPEPGTHRLVLLPSFVFRPWITMTSWGDTALISYPVADEHVVEPSSAPSPQLVKLLKALGDEGRLRLLQRMRSGAVSLTEAAEEMDISKPTAHHHLAILRQAGLVTIAESGRNKTYALRGDPPAQAHEALLAYLSATPGSASATA